MAPELFELELLGGAVERRYRKMRPEVEQMPWGTLDLRTMSTAELVASRRAWTGAAFQEHRTGVACAATLRALMEARAPLDLIALATRFPLDEMVHVELCARMAMELGGGTEIQHDPSELIADSTVADSPLMRSSELVVRFFCVGEALSIPLLRGTYRASRHPLSRAVLARIVKDEAMHGTFGWRFLDWAIPLVSPSEKAALGRVADHAIGSVVAQWKYLRSYPRLAPHEGDGLAWMQTDAYLSLAERSLSTHVIAPLKRRGILPLDYRVNSPSNSRETGG